MENFSQEIHNLVPTGYTDKSKHVIGKKFTKGKYTCLIETSYDKYITITVMYNGYEEGDYSNYKYGKAQTSLKKSTLYLKQRELDKIVMILEIGAKQAEDIANSLMLGEPY